MSEQPVKSHLTRPSSGYFGKAPGFDDFISWQLPQCFIQPWDQWLRQMIATAQQQLGDRWLDLYFVMPIYRFVLAPGICGETTWIGVLMPSVDQGNRCYPMTIAAPIDNVTNLLSLLQQQQPWYQQAEKLILSVLSDRYDITAFDHSISCLVTEPETVEQSSESLNRMVDNAQQGGSVWLTQGSQQVEASLLIYQGMPSGYEAVAMLDGHWQKWQGNYARYPAS